MIINQYILVFFLWVFTPVLHPLHLTVSNIDFNSNGESIQVSIKVYIDDFETVLFQRNGVKVQITDTGGSFNLCDSLIDVYINENFNVSFDSKDKEELKFISKEQKEAAVFLKYEINADKDFDRIFVENSILTDLYGDQKNLVFVVYGDKKVGYTLDTDNISFVFELGD